MEGWSKKLEWTKRSDTRTFLVKVSRHMVSPGACEEDVGVYRWCVYAYIYPAHPRFARFEGDKMFQPAASELPLNWYPSYLELHESKGQVVSVQVGADYNHDRDSSMTHVKDEEGAARVFGDAQRLFDFLEAESKG